MGVIGMRARCVVQGASSTDVVEVSYRARSIKWYIVFGTRFWRGEDTLFTAYESANGPVCDDSTRQLTNFARAGREEWTH